MLTETPLTHPAHANVVELDVRDDLRNGREPFSRIMSSIEALAEGDVLHLRAIFEPAPLFRVLGKKGFMHESQQHGDQDWSVWFWREAPVQLDVRELDPPEPMVRTLAALETLLRGQTLVQINARVPQFLLPILVERGFSYEIDESNPDHVLVRIRHAVDR